MHDLTDTFVAALSHKSGWDPTRVRADVIPILKREGGIFKWGQTAGEEWMTLESKGRENYALIWTHAPLAIVRPHIGETLREYLSLHNVCMIQADDWNAIAYSIDPAVVRTHGVPYFWHVSESDSFEDAFSVLDLVWATI